MSIYQGLSLKNLTLMVHKHLDKVKADEGWTIENLADYLELNTLTVRSFYYKKIYSDLIILILKLKKVIPGDLADEYRKAYEKEKIKGRKAVSASA